MIRLSPFPGRLLEMVPLGLTENLTPSRMIRRTASHPSLTVTSRSALGMFQNLALRRTYSRPRRL